MYQQVAQSNVYDQIPFYKLGRSFWFWSPQLQFQPPDQDPVVTGFAGLMRFRSMTAAHVKGAPFNGIPFSTFASQVAALAGQCEADPSLTFADTFAMDTSPGLYGGTDFWASLMMQLAKRAGGRCFMTSGSRRRRDVTLPERVFGRSSAQMMRLGSGKLADASGDVLADRADELVGESG
jgi:hypothetical protein